LQVHCRSDAPQGQQRQRKLQHQRYGQRQVVYQTRHDHEYDESAKREPGQDGQQHDQERTYRPWPSLPTLAGA